jgi:hypothetical protein
MMTVPSSLHRRTWQSGAYVEAQNLCKRLPASAAIRPYIEPRPVFYSEHVGPRLLHASAAYPLAALFVFGWPPRACSALLQPIVNCRTLRSLSIVSDTNPAEMKALLVALKASEARTLDDILVADPSLFPEALELVTSRHHWSGCALSVPQEATQEQWTVLCQWLRAHRRALLLSLRCPRFPDSFWAELQHMASVTTLVLSDDHFGDHKQEREFHPNLRTLVRNGNLPFLS